MATPTTLPATFVAGNVLTAAQMNALRGAFRVLQVVGNTTNVIATNATSTYADTGITATITPSSTSSKILVFASVQYQKSNANAASAVNLKLLRNATDVTYQLLLGYTNSATVGIGSATLGALDSPATTSALTYKIQLANNFNGGTVYTSSDGSISSITLMEISA
jgi:hypothetical protein